MSNTKKSIFMAKKMKLERDKQEFTEDEALQICFKQIKPTVLGMKLYNTFREYRLQYQKNGKLGTKAKQRILKEFNFEYVETVYRKVDKKK